MFVYPFLRMVADVPVRGRPALAPGGRRWCITCTAACGRRLRASGRLPRPGRSCSCWSASSCCSRRAAYWVDRYGIDFSQRGVVQTGASYTDVNAILPAKTVLAVIAVICAVLFFAGALRRNALLPAVGFGLLVLSAVIIGGVYPAIIQQFVVKPNELVKERPYLRREIDNTRQRVRRRRGARSSPYPATSTEPPALLAKQAAALPDVRLMDPGVIVAVLPAAAAGQGLLQVRRRAVRGPVRAAGERGAAGHGDRCPRHERPAGRPGQLDQLAPGLHPRVRRRRRAGQHGAGGRQPDLHRERHPAVPGCSSA